MATRLRTFLTGFAMGMADAVPGVSGGTIALIAGVYDRMIAAITAIDPRVLHRVRTIHRAETRHKLRIELFAMDLPFLLTLGSGAILAVLLLANAMHFLTATYPVPTYGFFTGLIAASAIVLYGEVDVRTARRLAVAGLGIGLAVAITALSGAGMPHTLPIVFVTGAIAICAMVLPGVSGSFLLLLLGQYEFMTGTLSDAIDALTGAGSGVSLAETLTVVAVFVTGAVVGLFSMAHLVERALTHYREATMTFLVSLMVGSLGMPLGRIGTNLGGSPTNAPVAAGLTLVGGAAIVLLVDRYAVPQNGTTTAA
ncbi:hypothetical protein C479_03611 [Halovivax asiaticus JCM 14624]|uniref:DUF368 domain-containing protein n=1 Tax=Halovivax asiaticus JCM 14624 TaxID=1227490 RepID=M0BSB5_9EURY|nr:DUF368 domain-containing protein [Halovivax asiaticus]ELZ13901.1 hypothetical protein C479_03611 [Halovivax asiaticus JCM 14624]